jgi:hypothetical protein
MTSMKAIGEKLICGRERNVAAVCVLDKTVLQSTIPLQADALKAQKNIDNLV